MSDRVVRVTSIDSSGNVVSLVRCPCGKTWALDIAADRWCDNCGAWPREEKKP